MRLPWSKKKAAIEISAINILFMGYNHVLDGREFNGNPFEIEIPFKNTLADSLPDFIKSPPIKIGRISAKKPFEILDIDPSLPAEIKQGEKKVFKLRIKAPADTYSGALSLEFEESHEDFINLSLNSIKIRKNGEEIEVDKNKAAFKLVKNQVVPISVQLLKYVNSGELVTKILADKPFEVEGSDPKTPFVVGKDGSVITIYIKAPDFSFSGDLVMELI
ncbi:MAG: hypothetical protein QXL16_01280 [Candidatus Micrarchaeaceae archaeon]